MTERRVDSDDVLSGLKDFQRRTAEWVFRRMFDERDPAVRFLVADEVGLGKTHVAKGVIAQVIDYLQESGDERHDIVYVCSNAAIARQNLRKLVPRGIEPLASVERLTMLALAELDRGGEGQTGINLLAITPGTSLKFGASTGRFQERFLAYTFLRGVWGADVMGNRRARWIFWDGVSPETGDHRLRDYETRHRKGIRGALFDFEERLGVADARRLANGEPSLRTLFEDIVDALARKRHFPEEMRSKKAELIGEVRRIMAMVGIAALQPDLVILDEFQRFKDLLQPDPDNFANDLAHRLFNHCDRETGRQTRTLLLSATPYRMYTTADEPDADHYEDFLNTCRFLLDNDTKLRRLEKGFGSLRAALSSPDGLSRAEVVCRDIASELRAVMARTERLAATPDRDGMLRERDAAVPVEADDLRAYLRVGELAESVDHHEPTEYWKAGPYLVNFMERYKLKRALKEAAAEGLLPEGERLEPGPGLLSWEEIEAYDSIDPQNGRLRWLLADLERHRAFELLWLPPSVRYYDTGSVYESDEATGFTKRLIFSGWALVPKVVSCLVSFEAERCAYAGRGHRYSDDYRRRGGRRLAFRMAAGETEGKRKAAAMTAFLLIWPSITLAELGDPRPYAPGMRPGREELLDAIEARLERALEGLTVGAPREGQVDQRWYWAAPLFLDDRKHPEIAKLLLAEDAAEIWEGSEPGRGLRAHLREARTMAAVGPAALGRPPDDLARVLAELALGGPAQCALRAIGSVTGLALDTEWAAYSAAWVAFGFRDFFNAPEVTAIVAAHDGETSDGEDFVGRYWRDVVRHAIDGNLQAVLDEHAHVLRAWLGFLDLSEDNERDVAAAAIADALAQALEVRTSSFRVDVPRAGRRGAGVTLAEHSMRTRFAVAFGNRAFDEGGQARAESVSAAFNSPFWPFVLTSTSVGQEGLDFHLWCHAVVHWNLPANPVDLEQREGRVHRFKGHAVRRNVAAEFASALFADGLAPGTDPWDALFEAATATREADEDEMVPYWVFHRGPAQIERHVPVFPFSREAATLPRLRKTLAAYRLAFGQPRQEELVEFLGADRTDSELLELASRLRIDLTPPAQARRLEPTRTA